MSGETGDDAPLGVAELIDDQALVADGDVGFAKEVVAFEADQERVEESLHRGPA